jgi:hypothetical protein
MWLAEVPFVSKAEPVCNSVIGAFRRGARKESNKIPGQTAKEPIRIIGQSEYEGHSFLGTEHWGKYLYVGIVKDE